MSGRLIGKNKKAALQQQGTINLGGSLTADDMLALFRAAKTDGFIKGVYTMDELYEAEVNDDWIANKLPATVRAQNEETSNTITINSQSLDRYGYTYVAGDQTVSSFSNSDYFTNDEDRYSALVYIDGNFTINSGQTFIPSNRKTFTAIYVAGDLAVNGSISMEARGADHDGVLNTKEIRLISPGTYSSIPDPKIASTNTAGGGVTSTAQANSDQEGNDGTAGSAGGLGGGGGGGAGIGGNNPSSYNGRAKGGSAGTASSFSGGSGGGGAATLTSPTPQVATGSNAEPNGGHGGDGCPAPSMSHYHAHGGAGNPGGVSNKSSGNPSSNPSPQITAGADGTGGSLVIFVEGNYTGSGTVTANGTQSFGLAGSSGGGHVSIFVKGTDGGPTPTANGGVPSSSDGHPAGPFGGIDTHGGSGGAGTARKMAYTQ